MRAKELKGESYGSIMSQNLKDRDENITDGISDMRMKTRHIMMTCLKLIIWPQNRKTQILDP